MGSRKSGFRVVARQLVGGYSQAVARFAEGVRTKDPDPGFFGLLESLNWAIAVDDFVREIWVVPNGKSLDRGWTDLAAGEGYVELLDAARYARNLVHHHWADALRNEEGFRFPVTFPMVSHSWVWRGADDLPEHPRADEAHVARNRVAYEARVTGPGRGHAAGARGAVRTGAHVPGSPARDSSESVARSMS